MVANLSMLPLILPFVQLPAFQVQVLKWTDDSGSKPERASLR